MKYLLAVLIAALAAGAALLPELDEAPPGAEPGLSPPPVSICPLVEAADRVTEVAILSSINGEGRMSGFSAGSETGSTTFRTGASGSTTIAASDVSAVGFAGGLIELPSETTVSGVVVQNALSVASEACAQDAPDEAFIVGGSTASGSQFDLQLMNPYAGSAVAVLTVISESGLESSGRFGEVTVPALSSVTLDMSEIIPGRERISVEVRPTRGSVLAVGHQTTEGRSALWRAVEPEQDWWIPVPSGGEERTLLIGNPLNTDVEYQVDLYGPVEFVEGFSTGTIPARGEVEIPMLLETEDAVGLRVISTSPVVSTLRLSDGNGLAMTTGSPIDALTWLLPGAESPVGGFGSIVIFNNGIDSVDVNIRSLGGAFFNRTLPVEAGSVVSVPIVAADGFRVESEGGVVALWTSNPGAGVDLAIGVPVEDG